MKKIESFSVWRYFQTTSSRRPHSLISQYFFPLKTLISKPPQKRTVNERRAILHMVLNLFVTADRMTRWRLLKIFTETNFNVFHIFIFHKKYLFFSRISISSFDEQDVRWIRFWQFHISLRGTIHGTFISKTFAYIMS